jgi:hypothetical protein
VICWFFKEILAYIEKLVAFSLQYRQNNPDTAGALGTIYNTALQNYAVWYAPIKYYDLQQYLIWSLMVWYKQNDWRTLGMFLTAWGWYFLLPKVTQIFH